MPAPPDRLPRSLLAVAATHALIIAGAGIVLFFAPTTSHDIWGFELTPFNTRFLAGIYLAALVAYATLLAARRWIPTRLVLVMAFVLAGVVLLVSLAYTDRFLWDRPVSWGWFAVYGSIPLYAGYFLWRFRGATVAEPFALSPIVRAGLAGVALAFAAYGVGVLAVPETFAGFWPWAIDGFFGRVYSGIFLAIACGLALVALSPSAAELRTLGLTCAAFGAVSPIGLAVVDADVQTVAWSSAGTIAWIALFGALCVFGLGLAAASLRRERRVPSTAPA